MDPIKTIQKYYDKNSKLYAILIKHSKSVKNKAIEIAKKVPEFKPDLEFIKEAAMLHDIGIYLTNAPKIECYGDKAYISHGVIGRTILEKEGYPKHALVCERHVGLGLTPKDIEKQKLPIPKRDMTPKTIEEEIICLADKFFSKSNHKLDKEIDIEIIKEKQAKFGKEKLEKLDKLLKKFKLK